MIVAMREIDPEDGPAKFVEFLIATINLTVEQTEELITHVGDTLDTLAALTSDDLKEIFKSEGLMLTLM